MNVLLLSGYHAASHQYWCEQLVSRLAEYNWAVLSLPDRHFYWRVRSNALSFAFQHEQVFDRHYDLVVATSMVDLCNLRGLCPQLTRVPTVLYFHENQFAYPERKPTGKSGNNANSNLINAQLTSVYSALAADRLLFNSRFNRDSFFAGAQAMLGKMPDGTPKNLLQRIESNVEVIPVPVATEVYRADDRPVREPVEIVWNHRWEYDKQPQVFFAACERLIESGYRLSLHVMGQSFREVPECFAAFRRAHADAISTWGYQPLASYRQILRDADIVVSAALHDFQGLGMLEGIAAGCIPVAPNRMAYPEYVPSELLYTVEDDPGSDAEGNEAQALFEALDSVLRSKHQGEVDISQYLASAVMPRYRSVFDACIR